MRLLVFIVFCMSFAPLIAAQTRPVKTRDTAQTAHARPAQDDLPQTTLEFKPIGDAVPISADDGFIGYPFCSADGTFYFNASLSPGDARAILAVSPKGEVRSYGFNSAPDLVNVLPPTAFDADGPDVYALVQAEKSEDLLDHDVKPDSSDWRRRAQYAKYFILHFSHQLTAPDEIQLAIPFEPSKFAALGKDGFIFLGYLRASQTPVLAVVDGSGQFQHYINVSNEFGDGESIVAHAQQGLANSHVQNLPQGPQLGWALSGAQFVHHGDSLLLLMPGSGSNGKVFTIRGGGAVESMALRLPDGVVAESLIPSANDWFVRVRNGNKLQRHLVLKVNPSDGKVVQIIHSPQLPVFLISCVRDGDYYGIHLLDKKGNKMTYIVEAAP